MAMLSEAEYMASLVVAQIVATIILLTSKFQIFKLSAQVKTILFSSLKAKFTDAETTHLFKSEVSMIQIKTKNIFSNQPCNFLFISRVNYFAHEYVSLIDCHNLSAAITSKGKSYAWGGKIKIWPPLLIDSKDVINIQVANEKIYFINAQN
jgi:hypothetical protein